METEEDIKQRQAIEASGKTIPGLDLPKKQPKEPRNVRRAQARIREFLDKLVEEFWTKRCALKDPEGEEAAQLFDSYNIQWVNHCKNYNARREPLKLRYEGFTEAIKFYTDMEQKQMKKNAEDNKAIDFEAWLRREVRWNTYPFRLIWYWIISFGKHEKEVQLWKQWYVLMQNVKKG